jgi:hypothetical protein
MRVSPIELKDPEGTNNRITISMSNGVPIHLHSYPSNGRARIFARPRRYRTVGSVRQVTERFEVEVANALECFWSEANAAQTILANPQTFPYRRA